MNIGVGHDLSIRELAETVKSIVSYEGEIEFDTNKPDGTPRKLVNVTRLNQLGWRPSTDLEAGLRLAYTWFIENAATPDDYNGISTHE